MGRERIQRRSRTDETRDCSQGSEMEQMLRSGRVIVAELGICRKLDDGDEVQLVLLCSDSSTLVSTHTITTHTGRERERATGRVAAS